MNRKEIILTVIISILSLVLAFVGGFYTHSFIFPPELQLAILSEARSALLEYGYDEPPPDPALEYGMIHGMVQAYDDPYTVFLEPSQHELETDQLEGHYGGIGASLGRDSENYVVLYPFPESPAQNAGIQDGDRLMRVDDVEISMETSIDSVAANIRGQVGKKVKITIQRPPDYQTLEFPIRREEIPLPSVTWHIADQEPRMGILEINLIAATTQDEILEAVNDLQSRGATHFVLDLRGNGGGYLETGIDIARLFLSEGTIIEQQYRGEEIKTFKVRKRGELSAIPIAILVDQYTASAAEIIAGSLQNHKRAILIGTPTFGKDSIQLIINLNDSSSIHVTTARWWIPGLDFPNGDVGLIPDIELPSNAEGPNPAIDLAFQFLFEE